MGYTTEFEGRIKVEPPLNLSEYTYLKDFANTRRVLRRNGPYFVRGTGFMGQGNDADVVNHNHPDGEQPGLWCKWEPTQDGTAIEWNGMEKFYDSADWMEYIIDHFLKPDARLLKRIQLDTFGAFGWDFDERFKEFTFDHVLNGTIYADGEDPGDLWQLVVIDNEVETRAANITYE